MTDQINQTSENVNSSLRELEELRQARLRSIAEERRQLEQSRRGLQFQSVLQADQESNLNREEQMLRMVEGVPSEPPAQEGVAQEPQAPEAPQPEAEERDQDQQQPVHTSELTVIERVQSNRLLALLAAIVVGVVAFLVARWLGFSIADSAMGETGLSSGWSTFKNVLILVLALAIGYVAGSETKKYLEEDSTESS